MLWGMFGGAAALLFVVILLAPKWKEMAECRMRELFAGKMWGIRPIISGNLPELAKILHDGGKAEREGTEDGDEDRGEEYFLWSRERYDALGHAVLEWNPADEDERETDIFLLCLMGGPREDLLQKPVKGYAVYEMGDSCAFFARSLSTAFLVVRAIKNTGKGEARIDRVYARPSTYAGKPVVSLSVFYKKGLNRVAADGP